MKKRQVLGSVFLVLLITYLGVGQTPDVTAKPIKLQLKKVSVQSVLVELAVHSEVSIGFERSDLDGPESKVSVDETQSTVKELLDHLVKEVPLYRWELCDGVINIVPVRGRSRLLEDFLRVHVQEFKGKGDMNKFNLRNHILDLPEVELFLRVNNLRTERLRDYIYRRSIYANDADLSTSGTDVLRILNNIIAKSEYNLWILSHDGKSTLHLSF
ncbi:MAG TPA: hypothetical protein VJ784_05275 [Pyrinomonadaceae bacterium]|nr:hypothetical protein [Pyrinomonadaceae bacterium]